VEHELRSAGTSLWSLTIPFERLDLNAPEDIVEEVGRIYGYNKINGILPYVNKSQSETKILPIFYISELIKSFLIEFGFSEVSLYSLVKQGFVETAKPLAHDKAFARSNLTDGMLDCVQRNVLNADLLGLDAIKIFEIGHVFTEENGERTHLAIGISQIKKIKGLKSQDLQDDILKKLCEKLDINIKGRTSKNKAGNIDVIEFDLTEISEQYKTNFDIKNLGLKPSSNNHYTKFSLYPFIVRDIAVFVPESVTNEKVWEVIVESISASKAKELLVRHSLFDTFKKEGRVSYAFRMVFQSMDRTLTDEEINQVMENINEKMKESGWEVR
jgi:phenylalanyl-tRNA synthetase beta chain